MKVLLTLEGGFAKTIYEGDKGSVEKFLKGFQYSRKTNLESPEVIGVLNEMISVLSHNIPIGTEVDWFSWSTGVLAAMENKTGKLEVIE